jgi:hypothetical protein
VSIQPGQAQAAKATDQLRAKVRLAAFDQAQEQRVLLGLRQARDPAARLLSREGFLGVRAAGRRGIEQVAVDAEERGERFERGAEPAEPGRARGLDLVVIELTGLHAQQPAQVERPQVAAGDVGAQREERGDRLSSSPSTHHSPSSSSESNSRRTCSPATRASAASPRQ